jgi:hypothetical protein
MNSAHRISEMFLKVMQFEPKNQSLSIALETCGLEFNPPLKAVEIRLYLLSQFDQTLDTVFHLRLRPEKIQTMAAQITQIRNRFLTTMNLSSVAEFDGNMQLETSYHLIDAFGSAIEASQDFGDSDLDRTVLLESTTVLLKQVSASKLPDYAKKVLELKLHSLTRLVSECTYLSDEDVRRRVKSIYADFCSDFCRHDIIYEDLGEKILRWGRNIMSPGIFMLSLTSDVAGVAGLLEGPKN